MMRLYVVICYGCRRAIDLQRDAYFKTTDANGIKKHFHNTQDVPELDCFRTHMRLQKLREVT